ncbi:V-type ATPase 116kDa subunit family protein [Oceanispirochaeta sp.]|jgi:V/A-type H+-transporting ATPase subunit I|uniref:V-type ATP synthase subunit I n=1 Tax=Oceanispirochaeta sp. TaxID=2035350 RepID=UPI0026279CCE|nr:V-type ATPase 116kDa subunit family protein [Oceanispirochaeta sp.]MDA3958965.1 ATPase V [Oceanispirochaeta sp.]
MMFTSSMTHLTAVVLKKDSDAVTKALLQLGALDFVRVSELSGGSDARIRSVQASVSSARIIENRRRIEMIMGSGSSGGSQEVLPVLDNLQNLNLQDLNLLNLDEIEKKLSEISSRSQEIKEEQRLVQQEIHKFEDMIRQLSMYGSSESITAQGLRKSSEYSFLTIQTGTMLSVGVSQFEKDLKAYPSVSLITGTSSDKTSMLVISLKKDEKQILRLLDASGWMEGEIPLASSPEQNVKENALSDIQNQIVILKEQQASLHNQYQAFIDDRREWFQTSWSLLRINELFYRIQSFFSATDRTVLFSGWLPTELKAPLELVLYQAAQRRCFLEWHEPGEITKETKGRVTVPVQLKNPGFLKPFEMLVKNFSLPEYGSIDPTPFVAVLYLMMFGLMFGDAGHGLVLVLLGFLGKYIFRKSSDSKKKLSVLILYCGLSAIVAGVLFGSYFGHPLFPPLWFNYHAIIAGHPSGNIGVQSIYDILLITIYFGIAVLGTGLILNWINLVRKKNWMKLFFDKAGITGGWMYGAGVYTGFYFVHHLYKTLPGQTFLLIGFGIPSLLLLSKEPVQLFLDRKAGHKVQEISVSFILTMLMEWIVELLEVFSGYLANTLSFMRVAGLGIAHVSLMIAFFQMAHMADGPGGEYTVWSYLILLAGNILVIALEGLSAGIQSLRLNYYEFFSKYFSGSGRAYSPVSIRNRV